VEIVCQQEIATTTKGRLAMTNDPQHWLGNITFHLCGLVLDHHAEIRRNQIILAQIIFGWPFIIISLLLAVTGVLTKRPGLLVAGAAFYIPPAWYLRGFPILRWAAILLPVLIACAALYVKREKIAFAWILLSVPILVSVFLALLVVTQNMKLSGG